MLRNLDWLHDLDVQYDASTFDTDPFEPQPDGGHTIFPFWVPRPNGSSVTATKSTQPLLQRGYVELPYTLPQDSTLFLVLRETTPEIWMRKLDWIAQHGGMVLLDAHPDYMSFRRVAADGNGVSRGVVPRISYLRQNQVPGEYWHALPKEVAEHIIQIRSSKTNSHEYDELASLKIRRLRGKHAAVLLFSQFPADPRPRRAAEALAAQGVNIDLICFVTTMRSRHKRAYGSVNVSRVRLKRQRGSKLGYVGQYATFLLASFFYLASRSLRRRYDLVHVHNMPDVLVFSAIGAEASRRKSHFGSARSHA